MFTTALNFYHFFVDTSLTFHHDLMALSKKLYYTAKYNFLLNAIRSVTMGCWCQTLLTDVLSFGYLTVEYCKPVWCCSAYTCLIDSVLHYTLCIVTGCLHFTPIDHLSKLSGIQPTRSNTFLK